MNLQTIMRLASSALGAESTRVRVISENIANTDSVMPDGQTPYRRKITTFAAVFDRSAKADLVKVKNIGTDNSEFIRRYEPNNPRASADGYVSYPNIQPMIEMSDLRDAERSYKANVQVIQTAKQLFKNALDILKA
jgi:flagellar basal-body rod protein FlgC